MSTTYRCEKHTPIIAETIKDAARIFANRKARAEFGVKGEARTCEIGAYAQDGRLAEFSAFIGITRGNETTGRNVHFTVYRQ